MAASSLSLLSFSAPFRKKKLENTVYITLNVDTGQITNKDVGQYCHFTGQPEGTSAEDFTVDVNQGDTIVWQGVSTNAPTTDIVHINSIHHHHGKNAFDQEDISGDDQNSHKISRKALHSTEGQEAYKYTLSFTVFNNGVRRKGTFHIDPKIQVH